VTICVPRFVSPAVSSHDDAGPVGRGVAQLRRHLQRLNEVIDVFTTAAEQCRVLVLDEHFELDADRLQPQQRNPRHQTPPRSAVLPPGESVGVEPRCHVRVLSRSLSL